MPRTPRVAMAPRPKKEPVESEEPAVSSDAVAGDMRVAFAVEIVGTFALIFISVGALAVTRANDAVGAALAYGLTTAVLIGALGHLSAALFNPAVALAFAVTGRMTFRDAGIATVGQAIGAVLGAAGVVIAFPSDMIQKVANGTPAVGPGAGAFGACAAEAVATFLITIVLYGAWFDHRNRSALGPLYAGLAVVAGTLATAGISGGIMNPARWFGPALYNATYSEFWVWIVGPCLGAVLAGVVYQFGFLRAPRG